ncbi:UDP-N-acetylglucosamine-peptide N-acetylglucosaminyltransferase [Luteibacter sp. PPL201]|uniref:UDP-N-acetylglucosamine-peptide N-acetylglucosaminyltransferase n=1 Tax=Luteibacter sahnii TaxID=3021977 RepID=A0ABT6BC57_9GAMM
MLGPDTLQETLEHAKSLYDQGWASSNPTPLFDATARVLRDRMSSYGEDVVVLTCLGAVLCDMMRPADAEAVLERAVALGSTDRHTFFNLFVARLQLGQTDAARQALERSTSLEGQPSTWTAYFDPHGM